MLKKQYSTKQTGFTIVELLIVIVVIGILAAITIVAYNGIQTRAENTKTTQAVAQYVKAILSYSAINGMYPVETGYPCLGAYPPATPCGAFAGGNCFGTGYTTTLASFDANMKTIFNSVVPEPSTQIMSCGGVQVRGAYYYPSNGKIASIYYFLRGNQPCDLLGGVQSVNRSQLEDTTRCIANLATLP